MTSTPADPRPRISRLISGLRFIASAGAAASTLHFAAQGRFGAAALFLVLGGASVVVPELLERSRRRAVYRSGNVREVLDAALSEGCRSESAIVLKRALAFASLGVTGPARLALQGRPKKALSEDEREELLMIEALVEAFDGEHTNAHRRIAALELLPLTEGFEKRSRALRQCLAAIVRAFDGHSEDGDLELLLKGRDNYPILHWATCYAAAVLCARRGERGLVRALLTGAPKWSNDSAFELLHRDLMSDLETIDTRKVA
jgi:hypothetical protein